MPILTLIPRASGLRLRLQMAQSALPAAVSLAIIESGAHIAQALADAAPVGKGVTSGQLAESFRQEPQAISASYVATRVVTTQPTILNYVRKGTGIYGPSGQRIRPRRARALYWEGAQHPVKSVRGSPPNDFVTPVLAEGVAYAHARLQTAVGEALTILQG